MTACAELATRPGHGRRGQRRARPLISSIRLRSSRSSGFRSKPRGHSWSSRELWRPERPDAAIAEAKLARTKFERLGAVADADAAGSVAPPSRSHRAHLPQAPRGAHQARDGGPGAPRGRPLQRGHRDEALHQPPNPPSNHVASILAKLDLRSRAEAAAFAVREGQDP